MAVRCTAVSSGAFELRLLGFVPGLQIEQNGLEARQEKVREAPHKANQYRPGEDRTKDRHLHHRQDKIERREHDHYEETHEESWSIRSIGDGKVETTMIAFVIELKVRPEQMPLSTSPAL